MKKKSLVEIYEELVPGTIKRINKTDKQRSHEIEEALKKNSLKLKDLQGNFTVSVNKNTEEITVNTLEEIR